LLSPKVQDFLDGETNTLSAKDIDPDLKVFQPVKTRKDASIEEINYRLENAIKYLHLPAAYKDILICLRMIIRIKKKEGKDFHSDLKSLYNYACQYNFFNSKPYLENAEQPAFNLATVMDNTEFSFLPMPYSEIGYLKITELNKTDVKWMIAEFGDTNKHTSVSDFHISKGSYLEQLLIEKRKIEREAIWNYGK
jgi:hypothetical protein